MLSSLKMRTKLIGGYLFVIVLSLIVSGVSIYSINAALKVNQHLNDVILYNVNRTLALNASYAKVHSWLHQIQVSPNPELVEIGIVYTSQLKDQLQKVQDLPPTLHQDLVYTAREATQKMIETMEGDFFNNLQNGKYKQADAIFLDRVLPHTLAASKAFNDLIYAFNADTNEGIKALVLDDELVVVIIVTILGVIVAVLLGFAISNYIVRHTMKIKEICSEIQNGNFDLSIRNVPKDEIGDIYNSLQQIVTTLNKTIARVIAASNALKDYSHELNTASWSINDGAVKAENQSITVAAAADEMVSTTSDIAKNCHTAQETSAGTKSETNAGVEKVRTTVARIKEQSVQTRDDAEKVLRLAEQSQKIGSIVGTIDEIAAQTNLLALNAAIEAARAGEAGRGFAVVADEVRALASRTSKSTQEITAMVKSVQEDSEAATNSMNASVEQMEEMASRASELEETLNHIMYSVNDVNTQIIQIATAAEEQTTATAEISSNMQAITEMAQQSIDVATNAANISDYAVHLIDKLMKDLDFFTLNEAALDKNDLIIKGSKDGIIMEDTNNQTSPTEQSSPEEQVEPMPVK